MAKQWAHGGYMGRPQPRKTEWARSINIFTNAANGNYQTFDLLAPFKAAGGNQQGVTVIRNHIVMSVTSSVSAGDNFAWGLIRGQAQDIGASIGGAPSPQTEDYADWAMWRTETACFNGGGGSFFFDHGSNVKEFDVRSQRRLEELHMTFNLVVARITSVAASQNLTVTVSTLLKLP
jgi:hypothetical protein